MGRKASNVKFCYRFIYKIKIQRENTTIQFLQGDNEKSDFIEMVNRGAVFQNNAIPARESLLLVRISKNFIRCRYLETF